MKADKWIFKISYLLIIYIFRSTISRIHLDIKNQTYSMGINIFLHILYIFLWQKKLIHTSSSQKSSWLCHVLQMWVTDFQIAFHNVCFLVHWISCNSSSPLLNIPKHCFIFILQVHHSLKELLGFIVAYL